MAATQLTPAALIIAYVIGRSYFEPSPLNLIRVPYYWFIGDKDYADYLWETNIRCWLTQSDIQVLEEILDYPNLAFAVVSHHNSNLYSNLNFESPHI